MKSESWDQHGLWVMELQSVSFKDVRWTIIYCKELEYRTAQDMRQIVDRFQIVRSHHSPTLIIEICTNGTILKSSVTQNSSSLVNTLKRNMFIPIILHLTTMTLHSTILNYHKFSRSICSIKLQIHRSRATTWQTGLGALNSHHRSFWLIYFITQRNFRDWTIRAKRKR